MRTLHVGLRVSEATTSPMVQEACQACPTVPDARRTEPSRVDSNSAGQEMYAAVCKTVDLDALTQQA